MLIDSYGILVEFKINLVYMLGGEKKMKERREWLEVEVN